MAIPMGNTKKQKLNEIINGNKFKKFKNKIAECGTTAGCNRCGYLLRK